MTEPDRIDTNDVYELVLRATGARAIAGTQIVQSLWSGYGQILRFTLDGGRLPSVIVKHVAWPDNQDLSLIHI